MLATAARAGAPQSAAVAAATCSTRAISSTAAASDKILYTITDEAPALATYALLPIIKRFTDPAGVTVEAADISVASRHVVTSPPFP